MRFDTQALMTMQRRAYSVLTAHEVVHHEKQGGKMVAIKKPNPHYVNPKLTSSPGMLIQELPWVNSTQTFTFDFSQNGPQQVPGVNNNITLAKNDVMAIYAIQLLFGTGANAASMVYRSHGVLPADDAAYNSFITLSVETSQYINKMEGQFFRDNPSNSNEFYGEIGMQIINPIRLISGELGVFKVVLNLKNPFSNLIISANTMLSMRLHGVYGQAQG